MRNILTLTLLFAALVVNGCSSNPTTKPNQSSFSQQEGRSLNEAERTLSNLLPEPPGTFEWAIYRNSAVPKPKGWYYKEKVDFTGNNNVGTFAFSPENFLSTDIFEHGFTIQIISNFSSNNKVSPSEGAVLLAKQIARERTKDDVLMFDEKKSQIGSTFVFRYRDAPKDKPSIIVHKFMITNDNRDSLHIFTYESAEKEWKSNWQKYGTPILEKVVVIPTLPEN